MFCTTHPLAVSFALLAVFFSGSPATARSNAPAAAALKNIQKQPAELLLFPWLTHEQVQFETQNGMLLLTQHPSFWSWSGTIGDPMPEPPRPVLWSGKLGTEPLRFTLETGKTEEDLKDSTGKILCFQHFVEPNSTQVLGMPVRQFPVGSVVTLEVAREIDTAHINDNDHHLSEILPVDTLHLTASCSDQSVRKNPQNEFVFASHSATDEFSLTAPGIVEVEVRTAGGEWLSREVLKATAELQHVAWSSKPQTRLDFEDDVYDKNGSKVETKPMGFSYLRQN